MEIFEKIGKNSQNPEVLNFLGLFELEKMNFIEAIKDFSKAANFDKENSKYLYNLGNAYFYNGWSEEAQKAYSKALYLNPDNLDYRYSLAYLYFDQKDYQKAQKEIDAILDINPEHPQARVLKALILEVNKDFLGAKQILEENLSKGFNDDFTKMSLSKIYLDLNIFDKAKNLVNEVIEKNPENLDYLSDLANIYIKEKEYDKALEIAEKILELNPNYIAGNILGAKASYLKEDFENKKSVSEVVHKRMMDLFKQYIVLGGMPDVINEFNLTQNYNLALTIQKRILNDYRDDIVKYADASEKSKIRACFDSIPTQLSRENKKFKYGIVEKNSNREKDKKRIA